MIDSINQSCDPGSLHLVDVSPISDLLGGEDKGENGPKEGLYFNGQWSQSSRSASRASNRLTSFYDKKLQFAAALRPKTFPRLEVTSGPAPAPVDTIVYMADSNGKKATNEDLSGDKFMERSSRPVTAHCSGYLSTSMPEYPTLEVEKKETIPLRRSAKKPLRNRGASHKFESSTESVKPFDGLQREASLTAPKSVFESSGSFATSEEFSVTEFQLLEINRPIRSAKPSRNALLWNMNNLTRPVTARPRPKTALKPRLVSAPPAIRNKHGKIYINPLCSLHPDTQENGILA